MDCGASSGIPAGLTGNPACIRDCARSCVIRNGFESIAIGAVEAPRRPEPGEVRRPAAIKLNKGLGEKSRKKRFSYMKKILVIFSLAAIFLTGCEIAEFGPKGPEPETPSKDAGLTGEKVNVAGIPTTARKLFVLNEGGMGSNNATLDFLRFSDGNYVTGAFKKMNPSVGAGLGDVGNDIAIRGDEAWIVVNNSGIVEVISAVDETEIAAIAVPTPRFVAFDGSYAYVTSWAGAYANYGSDYSITDYKNPKGQVYRINLSTKKVEGSVEVGYQPEGIACYDGKLYVANSGGIASQLPPSYSYDNTVSIIDTKSFTVTKTVDVQYNLKNVYSDGAGRVYVTTLGNYWDVHSGVYMLDAQGNVKHIADYVSVSAMLDGTLYCIGTETEYDWSAASHSYTGFKVNAGSKAGWSPAISATTPYCLGMITADCFVVGDAGDYFNPGTLACYQNGAKIWTVTAGVCPGHVALW